MLSLPHVPLGGSEILLGASRMRDCRRISRQLPVRPEQALLAEARPDSRFWEASLDLRLTVL
jgi:hypothetical protein